MGGTWDCSPGFHSGQRRPRKKRIMRIKEGLEPNPTQKSGWRPKAQPLWGKTSPVNIFAPEKTSVHVRIIPLKQTTQSRITSGRKLCSMAKECSEKQPACSPSFSTPLLSAWPEPPHRLPANNNRTPGKHTGLARLVEPSSALDAG